jgi:hypothetical protein
VANGFGEYDWDSEISRLLGEEPAAQGGGLWDTVFQPVKGAIGLTGNVGGQLLGLLNPEAYTAAQEELQSDLGVGAGSGVFERLEALPGAGDVAAQMVPESVRESTVGQITGPVARMVTNALGDPTTYTPYVLGKVGQAALRGIPAYRAARSAQSAFVGPLSQAQAASRAQAIQQAIATGTRAQRAGAWMGQHAMPIDRAMMVGGLAYAPELVESVGTAASESWRLAQEGKYGEAATTGASGMLMAGLAGLIGKGIMSSTQADAMMRDAVRRNSPAVADAVEAVERGELPVATPDMLPTPETRPVVDEVATTPAVADVRDIAPETVSPEVPVRPEVAPETPVLEPVAPEPAAPVPEAPVREAPPVEAPPVEPPTPPTPERPAPEPPPGR